MKQRSGFYPRSSVDAAGGQVVCQAGGVLLVDTVRVTGLDRLLSVALGRWRRPNAVHDPAKVVCDLAVTLALGGDCLADVALLRAEPGVYGRVASDPTGQEFEAWLDVTCPPPRRRLPQTHHMRRDRLPGR